MRKKDAHDKIRAEKWDIEIQKIIREYSENLYSNKLENLEETINFYRCMAYQN